MGQSSSTQILIHPLNTPSQRDQDIPFSEWVTLLTVALAPLVAHIAAGTPYPSVLSLRYCQRPRWHDSICLYNPTSIFWRYAAIADRRIRARDWGVADMAASNALFWTGTPTKRRVVTNSDDDDSFTVGRIAHMANDARWQGTTTRPRRPQNKTTVTVGGWDGTEAMIAASAPYCTALPLQAHAELLSWDTVKTLIITLQGVQALYVLAGSLVGGRGNIVGGATNFRPQDGLDAAFFPLTLIGLFRLAAACWLTSTDFGYAARDEVWMELAVRRAACGRGGGDRDDTYAGEYRRDFTYSGNTGPMHRDSKDPVWTSTHKHPGSQYGTPYRTHTLPGHGTRGPEASNRFHPPTYLPSVLFRSTYLLLMLAAWTLALLKGAPVIGAKFERTMSALLNGAFYIFFMTVSCGVYLYYFLVPARSTAYGGSAGGAGIRSTVIPCVGRLWYKVYTVVVFAWMAAMLAVACCETVRMPCGRYTTLGKEFWNGRTDCRVR
ncbi:hypothetical protein MN608_11615 [Microdochium nivale]|nr:hypothetical protein MN608_11615 [Microdochium nivale]